LSIHYYRFTSINASMWQRSPRLEQLLSRCDDCTEITDWRADAFRVIAPMAAMPGVGAVALCAVRGAVEGGSVLMATPVRYVAEMNNVRLPADGILSLSPAEAQALAGDFNRVWHDAGIRLLADGADLFCVADQPLQAVTQDPREILDQHIDSHLPSGDAATRLRRLMSEIEMWLFEHAVNRSRIAAAAPAINGLWLWGCGPVLASLPKIEGWTAGRDPFFGAYASGPQAEDSAHSGVAVIAVEPGTAEWDGSESRRLERSVADLRSGRIQRIELSGGRRRFGVSARGSLRFWRRRRPWRDFFA
jgi:hypothetical protein